MAKFVRISGERYLNLDNIIQIKPVYDAYGKEVVSIRVIFCAESSFSSTNDVTGLNYYLGSNKHTLSKWNVHNEKSKWEIEYSHPDDVAMFMSLLDGAKMGE